MLINPKIVHADLFRYKALNKNEIVLTQSNFKGLNEIVFHSFAVGSNYFSDHAVAVFKIKLKN